MKIGEVLRGAAEREGEYGESRFKTFSTMIDDTASSNRGGGNFSSRRGGGEGYPE